MKVLVIGLEGAIPEILLEDERLTTLRGLMGAGCYGPLEGVLPPGPVPSWMSMATGRDPGSLGLYGYIQREDRSYTSFSGTRTWSTDAPATWDQVAQAGGRSILVGVPPGYPPRPVQGLSVACYLAPHAERGDYTHPPELAATIEGLVGTYPTDVSTVGTTDRDGLRDQILDMSRKQFTVVRHLLTNEPWDYFHFVEIGLSRIQQAFWQDHDPAHPGHDPAGSFADAVRDYYLHLDQELATLLESLSEDALVLIASTGGARRNEGAFAVNEWLAREGFLKLLEAPEFPGSLAKLPVDWSATSAWASGGACAFINLNVKGRDPEGAVDPADFETVRDDLKARLEAVAGPDGRPLGLIAHKPEELYRETRGVAPDLIVEMGDGARQAVGFVGGRSIFLDAEHAGPFDCNPTRRGAFILAGSQLAPFGAIDGVGLLDLAPTLLGLAELPPLPDAAGRNFLEGREPSDPSGGSTELDDDELVRDRLRGLGYIG